MVSEKFNFCFQLKFKSFKFWAFSTGKDAFLASHKHCWIKIKILESWKLYCQTKCFYLFFHTTTWYNFICKTVKSIYNINLKVSNFEHFLVVKMRFCMWLALLNQNQNFGKLKILLSNKLFWSLLLYHNMI